MTHAFKIIEHVGYKNTKCYYIGTYDEICDYLNRRYSDYGCNTKGEDLEYAIDQYGGYAWLYFNFFEVEIIQDE